MNTDHKRGITPRAALKMPAWRWRLQRMQECKTLDALVALHGQPHHKVQHPGFEIWHYPLGVESGKLYSIHVSVTSDQVNQVFLYFETTSLPDAPPRRRWWQFWKKKYETTPGRVA